MRKPSFFKGRLRTGMPRAAAMAFMMDERSAFAGTSIKQYVSAEQRADYVVYLASPLAATISGQALLVCGDTNLLS